MDAQVVFTKNGKVQRILKYELRDQIQTVLGVLVRHHSSLILIFIGAVLNYARQGQVFPTPRELVGTPDPKYCLHTRMIIQDAVEL